MRPSSLDRTLRVPEKWGKGRLFWFAFGQMRLLPRVHLLRGILAAELFALFLLTFSFT